MSFVVFACGKCGDEKNFPDELPTHRIEPYMLAQTCPCGGQIVMKKLTKEVN